MCCGITRPEVKEGILMFFKEGLRLLRLEDLGGLEKDVV